MKKQSKLKNKIISIIILLTIFSALLYISLPEITLALNDAKADFLNTVGKITSSMGTEVKNEIHEHRGHGILAGWHSKAETKTYENAAGNTGFTDINGYLSAHLNNAYDYNLGWVFSLMLNTSIFCQDHGQTFPDVYDKFLGTFHGDGNTDSNTYHEGAQEVDFVELWPELSCTSNPLEVREENYKENGVEVKKTKIYEKDILAGGVKLKPGYFQYTLVRVDYKAYPREFSTQESYIFTYSLRNYYKYNPAQVAIWQEKNGVADAADADALEKGYKLERVADAVDELSDPVKPTMSKTTDDTIAKNTGTVLDENGTKYKVGPIQMNSYSYGWTEDAKEFSGQSSLENPANADLLANKDDAQKEFFKGLIAGIVEAKVKLDNGTEILLEADNFSYSDEGTTASGTSLYSYPGKEEGYEYPRPNSKFYIHLDIADCVGATKIERITMKYKWTTADGNGGDLYGYYDELRWEYDKFASDRFTHADYHCDNSHNGYECVNDNMSWSSRSTFPGDTYHGNVNRTAHDFWCDADLEYCQYGYSSDVIYSWSTSRPSGIGSSCSWDWNCGKYEHDHDDEWDCSWGCGYYDGEYKCGKSGHTHSDSCYHEHKTTCQGGINCGYDEGDLTCSSHVHSSSCGRHWHTSACCTKYEHAHTASSCGRRHDCGITYCLHGHNEGKHTGDHDWTYEADHLHKCYGPEGVGTRCNCHPDADGGGHRNCYKFYWSVVREEREISQDLIYVSDAQVYEHNIECYLDDIPLVAKVEIDKFIMEVKHENEDTPYFDDESRKALEEDVKEDNPVYVETEDFVTYKLVLTNHSAFGVKVRADDILPDENAYKFISAYVGGTKIEDIKELRKSIIQINANSEASITITIQVMANNKLNHDDSDEYENLGRIITRNGHEKDSIDDPEPKDVDYVRTVDDDGPVVNHEDVTCNGTTNEPDIESSDWFKLNNYNAFIDKYVYSYDERILKENNGFKISDEESVVGEDGQLLQEVDGKDVSRRNLTKTTKNVSDGNVMDIIRTDDKAKETYKSQHPVNVEQGEKITYAIRVSNEAKEIAKSVTTGTKPATKLKNLRIEDIMHEGLVPTGNVSGKIFEYVDGVNDTEIDNLGTISLSGSGGKYYITALAGEKDVLEPNQYVEFYIEVDVIQSNMYLPSMENSAELVAASNINDVVIFEKDNDNVNRMISEQTVSTEFVRMKDLIISGYVWVDYDKDGEMNDGSEKDDVIVRLYRVNGDEAVPVRETKTKDGGRYTFAWYDKDGTQKWYKTFNHTVDYEKDGVDNNNNIEQVYQRVDKADEKDQYGNYTANSKPYSYYVEFEYDGVVYRSTQEYADNKNLNSDGSFTNPGPYTVDSNAMELQEDRDAFNQRYEYISYNIAYDMDMNKDTGADLVFDKVNHESYLIEDSRRNMVAKSFVTPKSKPEDKEIIKYLWLYQMGSDIETPKTEYLKFINLGLELREDVDLALTKDVYSLKTTINGEEMEYDFNLGNTTDYLNDYIVKKPYGFEIYEADYKYRVEQYISEAVEKYKSVSESGSKDAFDELNVEVTYRINLKQLETRDDEVRAQESDKNNTDVHPNIKKNTQLLARVHEVLDLYDDNFIDYNIQEIVKTKIKDANGYLKDKEIKVAEAWMFLTETEADVLGKTKLENGQKYAIRKDTNGEPIYVKDANGEYVKAALEVSNSSKYSYKDNDFVDDGYRTLYISGMEDIVLKEPISGEPTDVDENEKYKNLKPEMNIYVKYVLDKQGEVNEDGDVTEDGLGINISEETYTESQKYTTTTKVIEKDEHGRDIVKTAVVENGNMKGVITEYALGGSSESTETTSTFTHRIVRAIKLAEKTTSTFDEKFDPKRPDITGNGRGTENIAQINAYSIWYPETETEIGEIRPERPASLVDKDSNAGNIGINNTNADDVSVYEDMTYKTGIEIMANNTENTKEKVIERYNDEEKYGKLEIVTDAKLERKITGRVWDDARSEVLTDASGVEGSKDQYIGDGLFQKGKAYSKGTDADGADIVLPKINQYLENNYDIPISGDRNSDDDINKNNFEDKVNERYDIPVRNAKAEFIEIVKVPYYDEETGNFIEDRYYEEKLTDVTWDQIQSARTNNAGEYMLKGFKPGTYIVRFTYGDVEETAIDGSNKWELLKNIDDEIKELEARTDISEKDKYAAKELIIENRDKILNEQLVEVKDMLIFNGQDYKSTKYTGVDETENDPDKIIDGFETEGTSDARDDEIRRLEVNAYSEVMTNDMAEILKGLANGNAELTPNSMVNSSKELKALAENTYMIAETREFLVKPEKLIESEDDTIDQKQKYELEYMFNNETPFYLYLTALKNEHITKRDFTIKNVDLGIEYRPESQINLMKEIKEITLKTTGKNGETDVLVNLHFETVGDGTDRTHKIIEKDSIGFELVQFITNNYEDKTLINNVMSEESLQGLVYIQVDEEILQGCTIEITYGFDAQNNSEIDRISSQLKDIKYRDNRATDKLIEHYNTTYGSSEHKAICLLDLSNIMDTKYTASGLAKAAMYADNFAMDNQGLMYRNNLKRFTTNTEDGYYGRFVGRSYYTGTLDKYDVTDEAGNVIQKEFDTISLLKFDKILDYIDTNLEYEQKTNSEEMIDKLWSRISSRELIPLVSQYKGMREEVASMTDEELPKVTNIDGIEYKSMVVSVDDRNVDPGDPNDTGDVKNKDLSKFLLPKVSLVGWEGKDDIYSEEYKQYTGHIYLDVSKVLAAGSDADDKTYENMAEIVQFTTLNGRRTNFATTIGNADIKAIKEKLDNDLPPFDSVEPGDPKNPGSIEFITASIEPDTSATETITLIPPTGLMRSRRPIVHIMEATKTGIEVMSIVGLVVAIVLAIGAGTVYTTRRVQRRRIK